MSRHVAVLVGSLRKDAYSRKVAQHLIETAPAGLKLHLVEIGELPLYNEDLETKTPPKAWSDFRHAVGRADGVLFVTPEYNRSVPAALKNALDVGSRPYGASIWQGKPGAVISLSQGAIGGFGANHHLRQSLVFLDVPALQQPEIYLNSIQKAFDENGRLQDEGVKTLLSTFLQRFDGWVATHAKKPQLARAS
jgi:chromate reductase, NAD(P)H dehydrogenase (quinone)